VASENARLHVFFSGSVQGVGFRYTACHIARRYGVSGFVRNLPDGRVELVAEGKRQEVLDFVADIEQDMHGYIVKSEKVLSQATNEFVSFNIRH
jgi:acylphosphatase